MEYDKIKQSLKTSRKLKRYFKTKNLPWPPENKITNPTKRALTEFVNSNIDELIQKNQLILEDIDIKKRYNNPQYKNDFENESYRWISAKTLERFFDDNYSGTPRELSLKVLHLLIYESLTKYAQTTPHQKRLLDESDVKKLGNFIGSSSSAQFLWYYQFTKEILVQLVLDITREGSVSLQNFGKNPNYKGSLQFPKENSEYIILSMYTETQQRLLRVKLYIGTDKEPDILLGIADDIIDNDLFTHPICLQRVKKLDTVKPQKISLPRLSKDDKSLIQLISIFLKELKSIHIPSGINSKADLEGWLENKYPQYFDKKLDLYRGSYKLYLKKSRRRLESYDFEIFKNEQGALKVKVTTDQGKKEWIGEANYYENFFYFTFYYSKSGKLTFFDTEKLFLIIELGGVKTEANSAFTGIILSTRHNYEGLKSQPVVLVQDGFERIHEDKINEFIHTNINNTLLVYPPKDFKIEGLSTSLRETKVSSQHVNILQDGAEILHYAFYYSPDKKNITVGHLKISPKTHFTTLKLRYKDQLLSYTGSIRFPDEDNKSYTLIELEQKLSNPIYRGIYLPLYLITGKISFYPSEEDTTLLSGIYTSLNIEQQPISGEFLLQRGKENEILSKQNDVDPIIANKIQQKRFSVDTLSFRSLNELAQKTYNIRKYVGTYWGFTLLKQKLVLQSVFRINEDASVKVKAGRPTFYGQLTTLKSARVLSGTLSETLHNDIHLQFVVYPYKFQENVLQGFYNGFGWFRKYEIGKIVLIRAEKSIDYDKSDYQLHKLTEKRDELINKYPVLKDLFFKEDDHNLVNNLGAQTIIDPLSIFHSACYLTHRATTNQEKETALYKLQEAFEAGFDDKQLLQEELEKGLLQPFKKRVNVEALRITLF